MSVGLQTYHHAYVVVSKIAVNIYLFKTYNRNARCEINSEVNSKNTRTTPVAFDNAFFLGLGNISSNKAIILDYFKESFNRDSMSIWHDCYIDSHFVREVP